jgi:chromosomal replication initiation ATPase DnaA
MKTFETSIERRKRVLLTEILEEVIDVPREYWEVMRTKKDSEVTMRQIYIYLLYNYIGYDYQSLANLCGLKYHTSILRNLRVVEEWMSLPEKYPYQNEIITKVKNEYEQRTKNNTEALVG